MSQVNNDTISSQPIQKGNESCLPFSAGESSPILKEDKVLSPASRRVKDAAESLLITLLEQVGQEQQPASKGSGLGSDNLAHSQVVEETEFYRWA